MFDVVQKQHEITPSRSEYRTASDFNLIFKLLKDNPQYKIPEHVRDQVITGASSCLGDTEASHRDRMAACKIILMADKQNLDVVKIAMPKKIENYNYAQMSDEELLSRIQEMLPLLPAKLEGG